MIPLAGALFRGDRRRTPLYITPFRERRFNVGQRAVERTTSIVQCDRCPPSPHPIFCTQFGVRYSVWTTRLSSSSHHSGPPNSVKSAEFLSGFFSCKFARIEHQRTKTGRENRNSQALQAFPNFSVCIQTVNTISATQSAKAATLFYSFSTYFDLSVFIEEIKMKEYRVMVFEWKHVAEE